MPMRAWALLLAMMVVAVPAGGASLSGGSLAVGLMVPANDVCGTTLCLRTVEGRYHPATVAKAAPLPADRQACAGEFQKLVAELSNGRPIARQMLYKARRCRSLGLAPVILQR